MRKFRTPAAAVCGVLCVAGLVAGITYVYLARVLFEADWFADRAAVSLAQPRVARVVAEQATDQIITYHRELIAYRPLLLGTLEYVVASAPVRAVVRRTAKELHAKLISETGDDILLTVADLGVVVRNALAAYPEIAAKIPEKAHVALGTMSDWPWAKKLLAMMRLGNRLRVRSAIGFGVGILCGAAGVLLTRRKDRYLLRLGLGLAITSFVMAGVFRFGGSLAALLSRTDVGAELMRGIWPVFLGPLAIRFLILGGLGIVLVAAVTSLLEKVEPIQFARQWLGRALNPRVRPGWGFVRGVVMVALGLLVLYHPTSFLLILAVVAGSVLLYEGVQELFVTAVRFAPRVEGAQAQQTGRSTSPVGVIVVGVMATLLIGGGAFWLAKHGRDDVAVAEAVGACNGFPALCDRPLNQVAFATAHNAMSAGDIADWMFPNQERGVAAQLADGVRGFLIDVHYGVPVGDRVKTLMENEEAARAKYEEALGKEGVDAALRIRDRLVGEDLGKRDVYLGHGFCELGAQKFADWLEILRDFLIANPGEVVIIVIQDEGVAPADVARCFAETGLEDLVYRGPVTAPWPTLGEMVARDERVVVYAENNAEGVPWYHLMGGNIQETPYRFHDPSQFSNVPHRGGTNGSLLMMNHWIETAPASNPKNAEIVNAYDVLLARARACQKERGMLPNLVAVDFYRSGDLIRVVNTLNGVTEAPDAVLP